MWEGVGGGEIKRDKLGYIANWGRGNHERLIGYILNRVRGIKRDHPDGREILDSPAPRLPKATCGRGQGEGKCEAH